MATEPKAVTEEAKIDLFEDDDEFEEFEINQELEYLSSFSKAFLIARDPQMRLFNLVFQPALEATVAKMLCSVSRAVILLLTNYVSRLWFSQSPNSAHLKITYWRLEASPEAPTLQIGCCILFRM
ncbi:hypothetical protein Vadar_023842 [Vaccinium darrowii]|uniref:Uncharacterized protein n=1 Tax=Vaccinium darrowii TaxID=229202 RepID=A0ACB7XBW3_9ERIC|nr:hypothetical protein Vadar_023842 [Vaccinium darrowii]